MSLSPDSPFNADGTLKPGIEPDNPDYWSRVANGLEELKGSPDAWSNFLTEVAKNPATYNLLRAGLRLVGLTVDDNWTLFNAGITRQDVSTIGSLVGSVQSVSRSLPDKPYSSEYAFKGDDPRYMHRWYNKSGTIEYSRYAASGFRKSRYANSKGYFNYYRFVDGRSSGGTVTSSGKGTEKAELAIGKTTVSGNPYNVGSDSYFAYESGWRDDGGHSATEFLMQLEDGNVYPYGSDGYFAYADGWRSDSGVSAVEWLNGVKGDSVATKEKVFVGTKPVSKVTSPSVSVSASSPVSVHPVLSPSVPVPSVPVPSVPVPSVPVPSVPVPSPTVPKDKSFQKAKSVTTTVSSEGVSPSVVANVSHGQRDYKSLSQDVPAKYPEFEVMSPKEAIARGLASKMILDAYGIPY